MQENHSFAVKRNEKGKGDSLLGYVHPASHMLERERERDSRVAGSLAI